jgi:hypothetical protein
MTGTKPPTRNKKTGTETSAGQESAYPSTWNIRSGEMYIPFATIGKYDNDKQQEVPKIFNYFQENHLIVRNLYN